MALVSSALLFDVHDMQGHVKGRSDLVLQSDASLTSYSMLSKSLTTPWSSNPSAVCTRRPRETKQCEAVRSSANQCEARHCAGCVIELTLAFLGAVLLSVTALRQVSVSFFISLFDDLNR